MTGQIINNKRGRFSQKSKQSVATTLPHPSKHKLGLPINTLILCACSDYPTGSDDDDSSDSSENSDSSFDDSSDSSDGRYHDSSDSTDSSDSSPQRRCPWLKAPDHGSIRIQGTYPGAYARYWCDEGYKLWGNTNRWCLQSGVWGGEKPICKREICII